MGEDQLAQTASISVEARLHSPERLLVLFGVQF